MRRIDHILERGDHILEYLKSRNILDQYRKTKQMLLAGYAQKYDFKKRKPTNEDVYQFRINQKYRAFGFFQNEKGKEIFIVTKISDHQDF